MKTVKIIAAPIGGLAIFLAALFTLPIEALSQTLAVPAPVEIPPSLLAIPFVGDLLGKIAHWLPVAFQIVGAFAMIAAMTANETDDKVVNYILKAINFLGFNFGTAKNDPSVGVTKTPEE